MIVEKQRGQRKKRPAWLGLTLGLVVMLIYISMRAGVYAAFPLEEVSWIARDTLMNVPRLVAFFLALVVGVIFWGRRGLGLHVDKPLAGLTVGAVIAALWFMEHTFRAHGFDYSTRALATLTVSSFIVALLEEVLFRGVIYRGLKDLWGLGPGVWGSAAIFAVYHVQAQPVDSWPSIFMAGAMWATMRAAGIGMWWAILSHGVVDSIIFLGSHGEATYVWLMPAILATEAVLVVSFFWQTRRRLAAEH